MAPAGPPGCRLPRRASQRTRSALFAPLAARRVNVSVAGNISACWMLICLLKGCARVPFSRPCKNNLVREARDHWRLWLLKGGRGRVINACSSQGRGGGGRQRGSPGFTATAGSGMGNRECLQSAGERHHGRSNLGGQ